MLRFNAYFIMKCDNFVFQLQVLIIQITKLIFLNIGSYRVIQKFTLMYWTFETGITQSFEKNQYNCHFFPILFVKISDTYFSKKRWLINLNKEKSYANYFIWSLWENEPRKQRVDTWCCYIVYNIDKTRDSQYWLEPLLMDMPIPNILSDKLPSKICHLWVNINKIIYLSANQTKPSPQNNTPHQQCM